MMTETETETENEIDIFTFYIPNSKEAADSSKPRTVADLYLNVCHAFEMKTVPLAA